MKKIALLTLLNLIAFSSFTQAEKVVLIEEGTGTWCSWCPRGVVYGHDLLSEHPGEVILIAVHNGDPMEIPGDAYGTALSFAGLPSGHVDRAAIGADPVEWNGEYTVQATLTPPANIGVTTSFNAETNNLEMTVSAEFFETVSGDYRLGAIVVEDGVTGPAPAYDQSNSYSGGGAGPLDGWEDLPNPVPASEMVYDHVARQMIGDFNGTLGSLPETPTAGSEYDYTWNWTISEEMDPAYTYVVGVLINATTGEIINAGKSDYATGNDNAIPFFYSSNITTGINGSSFNFEIKAHDPDDDSFTISDASGMPAWMTLTDEGEGTATLSGLPTTTGTHTIDLEVFDGEHTGYQTLTVEIIEATDDWLQVGNPGFTTGAGYRTVIDFMDETPVMMYSNDAGGLAWYEFDSESWSLINNIPSADNFHWDFGVSPDQIAYYITDESGIKLYKWDDENWNQIGSTLEAGRNIDIAFANDGTPYITFTASGDNLGYVYRYSDETWTLIGDESYSEAIAVWGQLAIDNDGNPSIAYGTGDGWTLYTQVSHFDGSEWSVLGSGPVDPDNSTYFEHQLEYDNEGKLNLAVCISPSTQQLDIYEWEGSEWTSTGINISGGGTEDLSMQINANNDVVLAFTDLLNGNKVTVLSYNGTDWNPIGLVGFTPISSGVSLVFNEADIPFVSYTDADKGDKISVKKYGEIVGLKEPEALNGLRIYPNPSSGIFNLDYSLSEDIKSEFIIYNLLGEQVGTYTIQGNLNTTYIDLSHLNKGVYIYALQASGNNIGTGKIIIQ